MAINKRLTLFEARYKRAVTQEQLAADAHVSWMTVLEVEHGRRAPRPSTRRKLAKALGLEPWEIEWPMRRDTHAAPGYE